MDPISPQACDPAPNFSFPLPQRGGREEPGFVSRNLTCRDLEKGVSESTQSRDSGS